MARQRECEVTTADIRVSKVAWTEALAARRSTPIPSVFLFVHLHPEGELIYFLHCPENSSTIWQGNAPKRQVRKDLPRFVYSGRAGKKSYQMLRDWKDYVPLQKSSRVRTIDEDMDRHLPLIGACLLLRNTTEGRYWYREAVVLTVYQILTLMKRRTRPRSVHISIRVEVVRIVKVRSYVRRRNGKLERVRSHYRRY
jgi:hypothetical protein